MKKMYKRIVFTMFMAIGTVGFLNAQNQGVDYFTDDFDSPTNLSIYNQNPSVFTVTQENNALHMMMNQVMFFDGIRFVFPDSINLSRQGTMYVRLDVKVDSAKYVNTNGSPVQWGGVITDTVDVTEIPVTLSLWDDSLRSETVDVENGTTIPVDGEWHTIELTWGPMKPNDNGNIVDTASIKNLLFEVVKWPSYHYDASIWIDNISIGDEVMDNAQLSEINVELGTIDPVFDPATENYIANVPAGTVTVPTVTYKTWDVGATAELTEAADINSETTIVVTSQDGEVTKTYTVGFELLSVAPSISESPVQVYPVPASDRLNLKNIVGVSSIDIIDVTGRVVMSVKNSETTRTIDVSMLSKGVYYLKLNGKNKIQTIGLTVE